MGGTNIKQMYWCREGQKNQKLFCQASCFPLPVFPFPSSPVMPQPLIAASYTKDVKVFFFFRFCFKNTCWKDINRQRTRWRVGFLLIVILLQNNCLFEYFITRARHFYDVIVNEGKARVNYRFIEIENV